jgi:hypothetical protein
VLVKDVLGRNAWIDVVWDMEIWVGDLGIGCIFNRF